MLWLGFSTRRTVESGVPVGVVAAQSIGEPGTQLTMRTRYVAGAVMQDVTHGLPRVEELFEMRTPKSLSPISEISGKVTIETGEDGYVIKVKSTHGKPAEEREYFVPMLQLWKLPMETKYRPEKRWRKDILIQRK